jgi:integrase
VHSVCAYSGLTALGMQFPVAACGRHEFMNAKINNTLLAAVRPSDRPEEINDSDLKGFGLRVQPSGVMSYYVRYRIKGKQTRFILGRTTELTPAQARDRARTTLAGINFGTDPSLVRKPAPLARTLGDFIDNDYTQWALANRTSAQSFLARIRANFKAYWSRPLTDVNAWNVEKWRTQRLKHATKPAKATTVNRDLNALKAALARAVEWGFLDSHPLAAVKASKVDSVGVVRYLSADERQRLFKALDDREDGIRAKRDSANVWRRQRGYPEIASLGATAFADHLKPAVIVSLHTGLRQGELFSLRWADIDFGNRQLVVRGSTAKSGKTRHVPLNDAAHAALTGWSGPQAGADDHVFPGVGGKRMVDIKSAWKPALKAAAISGFRWHDMRHDFASRLVMTGVDLNTVRELLGHADLKMTLRYAHLAPEHKAAAVAKLGRF